MLSSITPLGERSRRQHFPVTAAFLAAGAAGAGAAVGALLGAAGSRIPLDGDRRLLVLAAAAAAGVAADVVFRGGVPTHLRQVDERWLHRYRGWVYGLGFGGQLGAGVATVVTTSAVYLVLLGEGLAPSAAAGATVGAVFGGVRGASVLLAARVDTPARLLAFHRRFAALERRAAATTLGLQALAAAAALALVL
jgi:hypothetical protein